MLVVARRHPVDAFKSQVKAIVLVFLMGLKGRIFCVTARLLGTPSRMRETDSILFRMKRKAWFLGRRCMTCRIWYRAGGANRKVGNELSHAQAWCRDKSTFLSIEYTLTC